MWNNWHITTTREDFKQYNFYELADSFPIELEVLIYVVKDSNPLKWGARLDSFHIQTGAELLYKKTFDTFLEAEQAVWKYAKNIINLELPGYE